MKYLDKDGLTYLWGKIKAKIPTKTSELTNDSGFSTFSGSYNDLTNKPTIPAQLSAGSHIDITNNTIKNTGVWSVTESASSAANGTIQVVTGTSGGDSTVNVGVKGLNNAAYKNVDTSIASSPGTNLPTSTAVKNFVEGKGYITSYTESDPIFSASAAHGISSSDITNWNSKTSNIGTITSVKMNGSTVASSGEADLGTVLTSHQSIKTINSNTITGTGNVSVGTITKVQANGTDVSSSGTANIPSATTSRYGVTKLSSSTSSTSTTLAATPSAVKSAYDLADSAANVASVASSASASALEMATIEVSKDNNTNPTKVSYKFSNGLMINTVKISYSNVGCNTQWGGTYASTTQSRVAYQTAFTTVFSITATCRPSSGNHWCMLNETSTNELTQIPAYSFVRGTKTNVTGTLFITAIGTWN